MEYLTKIEIDAKYLSSIMNDEEALDMITTIDKARQDWGFTERLAKYFIHEMKKLEEYDDEFKIESLLK